MWWWRRRLSVGHKIVVVYHRTKEKNIVIVFLVRLVAVFSVTVLHFFVWGNAPMYLVIWIPILFVIIIFVVRTINLFLESNCWWLWCSLAFRGTKLKGDATCLSELNFQTQPKARD